MLGAVAGMMSCSIQKSVWLPLGNALTLLHSYLAGWTRDCLLDWGSFIQLAVPSMLMMCIEWWTFEIGSFLAGESQSLSFGAAIPALVATS